MIALKNVHNKNTKLTMGLVFNRCNFCSTFITNILNLNNQRFSEKESDFIKISFNEAGEK